MELSLSTAKGKILSYQARESERGERRERSLIICIMTTSDMPIGQENPVHMPGVFKHGEGVGVLLHLVQKNWKNVDMVGAGGMHSLAALALCGLAGW